MKINRWAFDYQITDMGNELSLATFCHENGHMICDYPDLYDYGYQSKGIGSYCLMCYGGPDEKNPTQICAYLKSKSGWAKTITPISELGEMEAQISADENEFFIYPKNLTEYFIIENRNQVGRDQSLPTSCLAIWHVDELGSNNYEQMTEAYHYECSFEQADGRYDLESGVNSGDQEDLFHADINTRFGDSTTPSSKWWDGISSGLEIFEISKVGRTMSFVTGFDGTPFLKSSTPNMEIPDFDTTGIQDTISFSEEATLATIRVSIDITHTYRGDLQVTLIAPSGSAVVLHSRKGGRADDLKTTFDFTSTPDLRTIAGQLIKGEWTLHIQDLAPVDRGRLNHWELEIKGLMSTTVEMEESPGVNIPDNDPTGIERILVCDASGEVKDISISVDITHTFIRDLVVTLVSSTGTSVDLHNRTGGAADNIIKTYTPATTSGLDAIREERIQGEWKLKVADLEGLDLGKLNHFLFFAKQCVQRRLMCSVGVSPTGAKDRAP